MPLNLTRKQIITLLLIVGLLLSLLIGLILVGKRQEIRKEAGASKVTLALYPTTESFNLNGTKTFTLMATFTGGSSTEKLDYFKTEISFSNNYLRVPANAYVDTSQSGFGKIFRVDGPVAANESGKIIIELGASTPGSGPPTAQALTIAKIYFEGKTVTPSSQTLGIGTSQVVNNQAGTIPVTTQPASYTVGGIGVTPTPTPNCETITDKNICTTKSEFCQWVCQ